MVYLKRNYKKILSYKVKHNVGGLVDFGKVPATWNYTVKQVSSPNGEIISGEKPMDVGNNTDPEEFVTYPRGKQLPDTGTLGNIVYGVLIVLLMSGFGYTPVKKRVIS